MSFWKEMDADKIPDDNCIQTPEELGVKHVQSPKVEFKSLETCKGIYTTNIGNYTVHVSKNGKKHHVGTFKTLDEAYEGQLNFLLFDIKPPRKKREKKPHNLNTLDNDLSDIIKEIDPKDLQNSPYFH